MNSEIKVREPKPINKVFDTRPPLEIPNTCRLIIYYSITRADKPTNTAFAWMRTTNRCNIQSKELFGRDMEVHNAIVR